MSFTCVSNGVSCLGTRRLTCGVDSLAGLRLVRFAAVGGLVLNLALAGFPRVSPRLIPTSNCYLLVPVQSLNFFKRVLKKCEDAYNTYHKCRRRLYSPPHSSRGFSVNLHAGLGIE